MPSKYHLCDGQFAGKCQLSFPFPSIRALLLGWRTFKLPNTKRMVNSLLPILVRMNFSAILCTFQENSCQKYVRK